MAFPAISFKSTLRPSQLDVVSVAETHLAQAERKLYINAPPGSGKTVTGLYLWAQLFKCPAVVLSPNSAIQSQWLARMDLFEQDGQPIADDLLSSNPKQPALFTSLTYQSVTMPARGGNDLSDEALQFWKQSLLEKEKAHTEEEAEVWIRDLHEHNPEYFQERLAYYTKKIREEITRGNDALSVLHASSLENLHRLREAGL